MLRKNTKVKKLIVAALVGTFAAGPILMGAMATQAAPVAWGQDDYRDRGRKQTFTGLITKVDSDRRFDLRVGNKTYKVTSSYRLPQEVKRWKMVRVYGIPQRNNEIVDARVDAVNNGPDDRGGRIQTFTGTVIQSMSDERFDVRVEDMILKVKTAYRMPRRLDNGDVVRVVGERSGDKSIERARVEVIQRAKDNDRNRDESFTGVITKIKSDRRFEFRVDRKTFDVYTADRLSRYLKEGDVVRVTGRRSGNSDINNARVVELNRR